MSKKLIIGIVVFIVIIFLAVALGGYVLFSVLTKEKVALTSEQFETVMKSKGYTITDATSQYSEYPYVEKVSIAYNNYYQIEFYDLQNEDYATSFYNNNKAIFENSKGNVTSSTNVNLTNSAKYTLDTNGKYKVVSRIKDTVIYINADNDCKEEIKTLLDEIDY